MKDRNYFVNKFSEHNIKPCFFTTGIERNEILLVGDIPFGLAYRVVIIEVCLDALVSSLRRLLKSCDRLSSNKKVR